MRLSEITAAPAPGCDGNRDAEIGAADHIRGDGDIAQIGFPAGGNSGIRRVFHDIAGHHRVGFDADADAGAVVRVGAGRAPVDEIADQVALHDGEPAALLEVGDRHAHRRAVDNVVGDHGAFETEFGIKRDLAEAAAGVADDLQVGSGVAAHGGESRVADTVAAHDDVVGAEHVDGVAVLAGAAGLVHDAFDAVVDDDRAVIARLAAPDQDAAIAGTAHGIAGDAQPARIEREDRGISRIDRVPRDVAGDGLERDAVAAGIDNLAIGDAHGTALRQMQQAHAAPEAGCRRRRVRGR